MPNLFTFFGSGNWEGYTTNPENMTTSIGPIPAEYELVKDNAQAVSGSYSGRTKYVGSGSINISNVLLQVILATRPSSFSTATAGNRVFNFVNGKEYKVTVQVFVPSGSPIASSGGNLFLYSPIDGTIVSSDYKNLGFVISGNTDVWKEIEYNFVYDDNLDHVGTLALAVGPGPSGSGSLIAFGEFYFDDVVMEEVTPCDLLLGAPEFSKTDESILAANDGTATLNATSSFTIEYSLDNITFVVGALFTGLAPGTYTGYVRDTNPEGCGTLETQDIVIVPGDAIPVPPPATGGPLILDRKPLNDSNFLSWFGADGNIGFESFECTNEFWDIPNAYSKYNPDSSDMYSFPVMVPEEILSFYVNLETGFNSPNFSTFKLALITENGIFIDDVAELKRIYWDDGITYDIYCDMTIPAMIDGLYRLIIYDESNNNIENISGIVQTINSDYECISVYIQFRNSLNLKGFRYQSDELFLQQFRMRINKIDEQGDGELAQYRSASSGRLRNAHYELDRFIVLETYYFNKLAHRGMICFQVHDSILINGDFYLPKGLYSIDTNKETKIKVGSIEMYEQEYSTSDRYGTLENITVVGSDDDLLLGDDGFIKL